MDDSLIAAALFFRLFAQKAVPTIMPPAMTSSVGMRIHNDASGNKKGPPKHTPSKAA